MVVVRLLAVIVGVFMYIVVVPIVDVFRSLARALLRRER